MKVSINWIKQFIDFGLPPVSELVEKIGAQLGEVESVENLGEKYRGIPVVKVVECGKLENSDHLNRCQIDDGGAVKNVERNEQGLVQVITGAPNVHKGMLAVWLPPGTTVPESYGTADPFVLTSRPMRGSMSHGMLASSRELGLSNEHEGILEVDKDAEAGDSFAETYKLDDYVIDIENKMFTHRPDCFGALGVAREVSGILGHQFKSPQWYRPNPEFPAKSADLPLGVTNELPELVPRFSAIAIAGVRSGQSPEWLRVALAKVGQKPISVVVDLTNFYMLITGQPLHAYDYDKVRALTTGGRAEITVRHPRPGETIKLINGKEIEPRGEAIMIASGEHLIGVGGVMGGFDTEVDNHTQNIILEAANFDMYNIRRTSMAHGLFTDAVTRFNKGQSPLQTLTVLARVTGDIQKMAGGTVASELIDVNQVRDRQWVHPPVPITTGYINERLGSQLSAAEMKTLLENVEFEVEAHDGELRVSAPFWRTDIELREDIVEEVGRLYGFDKLPLKLPRRSIEPAGKNALLECKQQIRENLVKSGANEVLTYSFVHGKLLERAGQDASRAFKLANALSPELQYYRLSLLPSLLEKVHPNAKAGYDEFALFEIGKGHVLDEPDPAEPGVPKEVNTLGFVYAAKKPGQGAAYYVACRYLMNLLAGFQATGKVRLEPLASADLYNNPWLIQMTAPFEPGRSAVLRDVTKGSDTNGLVWGVAGEFKSSVRKALKLSENCAGFEIDPLLLQNGSEAGNYIELPKYPKVEQDISLRVPADVRYRDLYDCVWDGLGKAQPEHTLPSLGPLDIYQSKDDQAHKNITLRFTIASYERTLTDAEVHAMLDAAAAAAREKFGAEVL